MDPVIVFVNDVEQARRVLTPLFASAPARRGVIVACPPALPWRVARWAGPGARQTWRAQWLDRFREALQPAVPGGQGSESPVWQLADGPLPALAAQWRQRLGSVARVIDARQSRPGAALAPVLDGTTPERPRRLAAPVAVATALSAVLAMAD